MRITAVWILLILCSSPIISCNQIKKKVRFYPDEYQFPNSNLGNGKTFVYRDIKDTANLMFMDRKIINEDGKAYLLGWQYNQTATMDSEKYTMDKEIIESYIFFGSDLKLKGSILQNEVVDDGSRLGKSISNAEYKSYGYVITIKNEEYFLKDTVINWNGQKVDCIKTRSTTWFKLNSKKNPSANANRKKISEGYFAKGIGLIRYHGATQQGSGIMELVEIRDMTRLP